MFLPPFKGTLLKGFATVLVLLYCFGHFRPLLCLCVFQANDAGDFFPIWGTCMGLQLLTVLVAGENLLTNTAAENIALPLNLTGGKSLPQYSSCLTPCLFFLNELHFHI